jgi:hypothetical protein
MHEFPFFWLTANHSFKLAALREGWWGSSRINLTRCHMLCIRNTHLHYLGRVEASDFVLDHTTGIGWVKRFKPSHGVLIGLSPVNRKTSYSQPPKQHPKNGATIGTYEIDLIRLIGVMIPRLAYPEIVATSRPNFMAISDHVGDQARTKVTREVDRVSCFPAKTSTDAKDDEEQA